MTELYSMLLNSKNWATENMKKKTENILWFMIWTFTRFENKINNYKFRIFEIRNFLNKTRAFKSFQQMHWIYLLNILFELNHENKRNEKCSFLNVSFFTIFFTLFLGAANIFVYQYDLFILNYYFNTYFMMCSFQYYLRLSFSSIFFSFQISFVYQGVVNMKWYYIYIIHSDVHQWFSYIIYYLCILAFVCLFFWLFLCLCVYIYNISQSLV